MSREDNPCEKKVKSESMDEVTQEKVFAVSTKTMRESDHWTIEHLVPSKELMYRAGKGIFEVASWKAPVGIICGKGNNAGDGFVVARLLKEAGIDVEVVLLFEEFSEDGLFYLEKARNADVTIVSYNSAMDFSKYGSILDCIFGTGFRGDVTGIAAEAIEKINNSGAYVVSADINSGLNGDTGEGSLYVKSDLTVSIGSYKVGLFLGRAKDAIGRLVNVDIGIKIIGEMIDVDTLGIKDSSS